MFFNTNVISRNKTKTVSYFFYVVILFSLGDKNVITLDKKKILYGSSVLSGVVGVFLQNLVLA